MWQRLLDAGGPKGVRPELIASLGIQRGQQGIYRAAEITKNLSRTGAGLAVAFRSYGDTYTDDLSDVEMKYRYPKTDRPGFDDSEIAAAKESSELGLPLFVVHQAKSASKFRDVRLATVRSWSDSRGFFVVGFIDSTEPSLELNGVGYLDVVPRSSLRRQIRLLTEAMLRFDTRCLVCGCRIPELLEVMNLESAASNDADARDCLLLCSLHATAFRVGLFAIEPDELAVVVRANGPTASEIGITYRENLDRVALLDREALRRHWSKWSDAPNVDRLSG
ncbi:MAG: hypothetical protein WD273_05450 [Trueperaceae bacterium]